MKNPVGTLTNLRVADVMRGDVVTLRAADTMAHAASVLQSYGVTGAPVVDDEGVCVGVLSATDFVGRELGSPCFPNVVALAFDRMYAKKTLDPPQDIEANRVDAYMSTDVRTIEVTDPILKAARLLCDERIHRLVVVDNQNHPLGVISSLDLVACLVVAVEE